MIKEPSIQTVRELFTSAWHFRVPIYQRAYSWGKEEIETLVRDVASSLRRPAYHLGSLVVHRVHGTDDSHLYDVIDGQQRLTTFFLLLSHPALREPLAALEKPFTFPGSILSFEERSHSTADLAQLASGQGPSVPRLFDDGINAAVETIGTLLGSDEQLARLLNEQGAGVATADGAQAAWLNFLLDRVKITVSELPRETDLNHYFEVMNTRGVQLEKHEVVKAHLIGLLGEDDHARFVLNRVWNAASDFTRPIQAGFSPIERGQLFGDPNGAVQEGDESSEGSEGWSVLQPGSADELLVNLSAAQAEPCSLALDLDHILDSTDMVSGASETSQGGDAEGRYGAIIDFPNFLLHVLRLQFGDAVSLDDKQLVAQFQRFVTCKGQCLEFTQRLLRAKYLFDTYVIKISDDPSSTLSAGTQWALLRFHSTGQANNLKLSSLNTFPNSQIQARILRVQAMYQVTQSRRIYKQFLFSILKFLDEQWQAHRAIDGAFFLSHLHAMANNDLATIGGLAPLLDAGTGVPHFALNLLDYKLWLRSQPDSGFNVPVESARLPDAGKAVEDFRFAYRTSVEHFLAVNFAEGSERDVVDHFGNLCLMTRDENSRRSDHDPAWKVRKYGDTDQSLKFAYMSALQESRRAWGATEINEQGEVMRKILETPLPVSPPR